MREQVQSGPHLPAGPGEERGGAGRGGRGEGGGAGARLLSRRPRRRSPWLSPGAAQGGRREGTSRGGGAGSSPLAPRPPCRRAAAQCPGLRAMPAATPAPRPPPPPARPAPGCPTRPTPGKCCALGRPPGRGRRRNRGSPSVSGTGDPAPCAAGPQCGSRGGARSNRAVLVRACICARARVLVCVSTPAATRLLGVNAIPSWVPVPRCPEGPAWETRGHPARCGGAAGEGSREGAIRPVSVLSISTSQVLYLELTSFHPLHRPIRKVDLFPFVG